MLGSFDARAVTHTATAFVTAFAAAIFAFDALRNVQETTAHA